MSKSANVLGLINARGGSKGVPGKNKKLLLGKPLITYSIEAALLCDLITDVIVSSDDAEICNISVESGARVPFIRPPELAEDNSKQIDVIKHAVIFLEKNENKRYDYICLLQPTCPLRTVADIRGAIELILTQNADSVISVTDVGGRHPKTLYTASDNHQITPYIKSDMSGVQRQDFEDLYWRTGAIYIMKRDIIMERGELYGDSICGYYIPENRSFNIDSPFDWELCEAYLQFKAD